MRIDFQLRIASGGLILLVGCLQFFRSSDTKGVMSRSKESAPFVQDMDVMMYFFRTNLKTRMEGTYHEENHWYSFGSLSA